MSLNGLGLIYTEKHGH